MSGGVSPATAVIVTSASTTDSRSVTIDYQVVTPPDPSRPLTFGVYRSADDRLDGDDLPVGSTTVFAAPALDLAGQPADAVGEHRVTLTIPDGLPPTPERPYTLVVANPSDPAAGADPAATASFRSYTIGVVTHGGLINKAWKKHGPPWELVIARSMRDQGFDQVIPYNWVSESSDAGAAVRQGPRLARQILAAAAELPADAPVNLVVIGHSEGTVVNSQALLRIENDLPPNLKAGYVVDVMLDPHAANNGVPGQQYSVSHGILGAIAKGMIDSYQSKAKDPPVVVPPIVDDAQVFYQHTPASRDHGVNSGLYNLWGQVPVKGPASYFDLTANNATHSGKTGVPDWYIRNVVPTLGEGAPEVRAATLNASLGPVSTTTEVGRQVAPVVATARPTFSGTAAPGSTVRVLAARLADPSKLVPVGRVVADGSGAWSLETRPLADGRYRAQVVAHPPHQPRPTLPVIPKAPLGRFVVDSRGTPG
jgi:hypothetical protein